jgi:N-methylhydantoinase A/oxoprolinase/acetone carboxylase beta subunit
VLSFDMGGTTAKAGTIFGGVPEISASFEAAGFDAQRPRGQGQRLSGALSRSSIWPR